MEEHIERLRLAYEGFGRTGEWPDADLLAPDFELHQDAFLDSAKVFRGADAPAELMGRLAQAFRDVTVAADELLQAPDGRVVALIRTVAHGRGSGTEVQRRQAHVWTFADGTAIRMMIYERPNEALAAVGLAE